MTQHSFHLIKPHVKDLGGFTVKRLLPSHPHKMVGPFIFFDHMGPATFGPGAGLDVRPHPHIGLATVTYLFEGVIMHRDSLGSVQPIHPGDVNWMTAGRGIVHSERSPDEARHSGGPLHGIQIWVALPKVHETVAPAFEHHPASTLPAITLPGVSLRLIAGTAFGHTAPASTFSDMFYAAGEMAPNSRLTVPADYPERAIYLVDGEVSIDGTEFPAQHMAVLPGAQELTIEAKTTARIMLLGGKAIDGDRFIWWNFVASSKDAIAQAKEDWRAQRFGKVPEETEWIPLPDEPKPPEAFS
ncbi:pirin family protein [Noviherbaspirillum sp.]|uniref:pirin family protein n=1 Tax=Noviherbaspirillum sp. TaxID=1926288 RepID=UPI002B4A831E|nr:pirin family protein [Noviherbaspirillum sp.]HJV82864.1 pirin family protein [Noviherbaspirillum sp.]